MLQFLTIAYVSAISISTISAHLFDKRAINDPVNRYLNEMCRPLWSNTTRNTQLHLTINQEIPSLAFSPFPCEQTMYLEEICTANGTTEVDFLAEQECLCGSDFFKLTNACSDCWYAHGYVDGLSPAQVSSKVASLQTAECSPSPPYQPYSNLLPPINITSVKLSPTLNLGNDRFPNMTAVSNYFTETRSATPGSITGSATARLTSWTNQSGIRYTPTSTPSQFASRVSTSTEAAGRTGASTTSPSAVTSSTKPNAGTRLGVHVAGGLLALGLSFVAFL